MVDIKTFQQLALSFPDAEEQPHFERTSFRVKSKIFATLDSEKRLVCLMLTVIDQSVFCAYDKEIIYPVPNKWGQKGATYVVLDKVKKAMLKDALAQAYNKLTSKKSA